MDRDILVAIAADRPQHSSGYDDRETLLGLSARPNLARVDSFHNLQRASFVLEALPPESKQLTRSKSIGHIQLKQDAILQSQFHESKPELIPGQDGLVCLTKVSWNFDLASWIFR